MRGEVEVVVVVVVVVSAGALWNRHIYGAHEPVIAAVARKNKWALLSCIGKTCHALCSPAAESAHLG